MKFFGKKLNNAYILFLIAIVVAICLWVYRNYTREGLFPASTTKYTIKLCNLPDTIVGEYNLIAFLLENTKFLDQNNNEIQKHEFSSLLAKKNKIKDYTGTYWTTGVSSTVEKGALSTNYFRVGTKAKVVDNVIQEKAAPVFAVGNGTATFDNISSVTNQSKCNVLDYLEASTENPNQNNLTSPNKSKLYLIGTNGASQPSAFVEVTRFGVQFTAKSNTKVQDGVGTTDLKTYISAPGGFRDGKPYLFISYAPSTVSGALTETEVNLLKKFINQFYLQAIIDKLG